MGDNFAALGGNTAADEPAMDNEGCTVIHTDESDE